MSEVNTSESKENAHLFHFTAPKAGTKLNENQQNKVNEVIYEMSKGSKFLVHAQKQDEKTQAKIKDIKMKLENMTERDIASSRIAVDKKISEWRKIQDFSSEIIAVIDMDMFFAAVEIRDDPSLADKPVAVGGKSMISTTNYVARQYGVRSAMPGFIAEKLCPQLIFVRPDMKKYSAASKVVMDIFREYDPDLITMSVDEAFLNLTRLVEIRMTDAGKDLSNKVERESTAELVVNEIREKVLRMTKLSCSAGIGTSTKVAKIASDRKKPNGQFLVGFSEDEVVGFLRQLPVRKITGVGKVTEKLLVDGFGVATVQDVFEKRYEIHHLLTPASADFLIAVSIGCGSSFFGSDESEDGLGRKSISVERTFNNLFDFAQMVQKLQELSEALVRDMKKENLLGRVLTLKVKTTAFEIRNKQITFHEPIGQDSGKVFEEVIPLLKALKVTDARLLGLRMSGLLLKDCFDKEQSKRKQTQLKEVFEKSNSKRNKSDSSCPSCGSSLKKLSNAEINSHLDQCLFQKLNRRVDGDIIELDQDSDIEIIDSPMPMANDILAPIFKPNV